jgi:hypothetical protein
MKKNFLFIAFIALFIGLSFNSCSKDDTPDPNAGKTDPSTIATANLVAYFPFEGNGNDQIGNLTPAQQEKASFPTGRRGKAYQGTGSAGTNSDAGDLSYLMYNLSANSKLKTMKAFTSSMWLKLSPTADGGPEPMIYQIDGLWDDFGSFALKQQRNPVPCDTAQFQSFFFSEGYDWQGQFIGDVHSPGFLFNSWIHVIFTYDNATSKFYTYLNGVAVKLSDGQTNRYQSDGGPALGDLKFANANHFIIGSWYSKATSARTDTWMGSYKGLLDELRIYDRALTATEVKALYDAEVTQIN